MLSCSAGCPHSIVSPSEKRFHPLSDKVLCSLPLLLLCEVVFFSWNKIKLQKPTRKTT